MGVFLWLSDLHLDPFYGTNLAVSYRTGTNCSLPDNATLLDHPYGRVGCDAPPSLLESALQNVKDLSTSQNNGDSDKNIDFVLVVGDFARHSVDALAGNNSVSTSSSNNSIDYTNKDISNSIDPVKYAGSILSTCISSIQTALPNVPIIPVLGNNDFVPDYYLGPESFDHPNTNWPKTDPKTMLASVVNGLKGSFVSEEEASTFQRGGYFSRLVPLAPSTSSPSTSSILVLSLNTVLYSTRHESDSFTGGENSTDHRIDDPYGQFKWMESQLQMAAASSIERVTNRSSNDDADNTNENGTVSTNYTNIVGIYLTGHLPPSIGSYRHSQFWHDHYLEKYSSILKNYSKGLYNPQPSTNSNNNTANNTPPPILGHFYGHLHTEEFRLLTYYDNDENLDDRERNNSDTIPGNINSTATIDSNKNSGALMAPLLLASSITPIFGSNPSYRLVNYDDESGALLDYKTHYLDLLSSDSTGRNGNFAVPPEKVATEIQEEAVWIELPSFVDAYGLPDLSLESFKNLLACLEFELYQVLASESKDNPKTNTINLNLWETFWNRQHLYTSFTEDGDDDGDEEKSIKMTDWLCTMGSSSTDEYQQCLETKRMQVLSGGNTSCDRARSGDDSSEFASFFRGRTKTYLFFISGAVLVVIMLMVILRLIWKKYFSTSRMYTLPVENKNESEQHEPRKSSFSTGDGVFVINEVAENDVEKLPNIDGEMT
eukprot:CAMPEP_0197199022 /NCGR_PEP_ID=MMETSP1423-20130617/33674_1 /TAXON_ID=476441 /ORGANISM="Pseudo-nitzschia heimii, Strain UNC1101" /LENGTH=714 /DNA_ID=CAMNT_0042652873 /DNA_START=57 /DNA_END=2201 /DNA_ORIENTATION=+